MLITSAAFVGFFVVVFALYWTLPQRWKAPLLLGASYGFYGLWEPRFLLLIAVATAVDYSVGRCLALGGAPTDAAMDAATDAGPEATEVRWSGAVWADRLGLYLGAIALVALVPWPGQALAVSGPGLGWAQRALAAAALGLLGWLLGSVLPRWAAGAEGLANAARRKRLLWLSLGTNLGILGCFKYFNFFIDSVAGLLGGLGWSVALPHWQLLLPVGVSFYSFKTLGYVIDCYRGKQVPTRNLTHYGLFLAFFPALLAGPIDRAGPFLAQLQRPTQLRLGRMGQGLALILLGLMKKVAIADGIAPSVSAIYQGGGTPSGPDVAVATALYALQIYGDFSGYTDMARGLAQLLGLDLALNFNLPYFSQNPSEFWRRWHISLSTWLRDYLYIPLGGSRQGSLRTYGNLMATMVLGGLWHGATWNFGLWGAYQGAILCVHRWFSLRRPAPAREVQAERQTHGGQARETAGVTIAAHPNRWPQGLDLHTLWRWPLFLVVTCYGWLLFGVADFGRIAHLSQTLVTGWGDRGLSLPQPPLAALLGMGLLLLYETLAYITQENELYRKLWPMGQGFFYAGLIFIILMGSSNAPTQFIYTQF